MKYFCFVIVDAPVKQAILPAGFFETLQPSLIFAVRAPELCFNLVGSSLTCKY
jgi:hypothetical protein